MNFFVDNVWMIPALPLGAFLLNILVLRPLDVANRDKGHAHGHDDHAAHGDAHGHEEHAPVSTDVLLETSYVTAIDTIDGHVDTPAVLPRARRRAQQTSGGREFIEMMDDLEVHPHHAHGAPTIFARLNGFLGILAMASAFAWAVGILIALLGNEELARGTVIHLYNWFSFGNGALNYSIDFYVDSLTAIMLVVVTGVSTLVQFYSQEYIEGEDPRGYSRFFAWLSLFTLSMLILVLAANFLLIYIGWELVGLCSYLLIGFLAADSPKPTSGRPSPGAAALKAFVTTRIGDFGFLIGILIIFTTTGTFAFNEVPGKLAGANIALITTAMILVFCGAVGKSAQFPLHVWLPDAMEGPTPVSALIHAATMVAAGVYLVARTFLLFHQYAGPEALQVVAYIGGFTALFAATIALVQTDVKRVLAYSTISQLGYMFMGLGVADTIGPGIFHLMTHAFFKALLFLGSGAVLLACSHNQDMRKMGGLASRIPMVAFPFLLATLAISGFPFFSGFFSKDEIIASAFEHGDYLLYGMGLATAFLTAFYMFRLWFLTFGGKGGAVGGLWGGEYRGDDVPLRTALGGSVKLSDNRRVPARRNGEKEKMVGPRIWLPLVILAVPTVFAGFFGWSVTGGNINEFLSQPGVTAQGIVAEAFKNPFTDPLTIFSVLVSLVGISLAWLMYGTLSIRQDVLTSNPLGKGIHAVLFNKYYVDEIYLAFIRFGVMGLSRIAVGFDRYVIDGIINGVGRGTVAIGRGLRRTESGRLQNYGAAIFGGALVIAAAFFAVVYFGK